MQAIHHQHPLQKIPTWDFQIRSLQENEQLVEIVSNFVKVNIEYLKSL